ncbi:restriction enzyme fragment 5 [Helicobacter acinonychis]|uniref:Restriction enzyme 5 n=1 Tax=Helicobacter acinonychis (strain Sheeba) TaxID=382638 RepID=Q17Z94_HELAH|nr:putative restriction enzyme fragment 5 [Helicobacter acinonychis str. Sheeba]STP04846.1 restriction enzyme fragment 5 [Helicobacter acinonychis]
MICLSIFQQHYRKVLFPDFIFWLQKGDTQIICFIDPKGSVASEYQFKVKGYKKTF